MINPAVVLRALIYATTATLAVGLFLLFAFCLIYAVKFLVYGLRLLKNDTVKFIREILPKSNKED